MSPEPDKNTRKKKTARRGFTWQAVFCFLFYLELKVSIALSISAMVASLLVAIIEAASPLSDTIYEARLPRRVDPNPKAYAV